MEPDSSCHLVDRHGARATERESGPESITPSLVIDGDLVAASRWWRHCQERVATAPDLLLAESTARGRQVHQGLEQLQGLECHDADTSTKLGEQAQEQARLTVGRA